ncbi:MAG TPA: Na(+)-translocating NADH-quinone reductase subunit A [Chitinophagales bacterium]|nr:Na(+)-translocating NADH-quinone reductase subunit A [Chitinophagales bacterium]HPE98304.1 Na(+)-translocating NADH-quinone reductase subunit A [Chitinophagales bacterium]
MSRLIRLTKGYDIKIKGAPVGKLDSSFSAKTFSVKPVDFHGLSPIPKLFVSEQTEVKAGDPLFYDKSDERIHYCSPVSGEVVAIHRAEKRAIDEVVILADSDIRYRTWEPADPNTLTREAIIERMLESGAWLFLRQRPYNVVASPDEAPKAIFISGFDSSPLAPDMAMVMEGKEEAFQTGIRILSKLTSGKIHLSLSARQRPPKVFDTVQGVEIHWFDGPHPTGNVGVQIHHIDPVNKGEVVWHIHPEDVANLATLFNKGIYSPERTVAVAGPMVSKPHYVKTLQGACIEGLVSNNLISDHVRCISGNVLTGRTVASNGHLGFFDHLVTVIEEGDHAELLGWLFPSYARPTRSMAYWAYANEAPDGYAVTTSMHGEERAFVMSGQYEQVLPMDIYPVHLLKAIMARDFDLMEGLGIYEVTEEDFALCEFVCTSKIDVQEILREGLDYMRSQN